jgi:hypothetical protein
MRSKTGVGRPSGNRKWSTHEPLPSYLYLFPSSDIEHHSYRSERFTPTNPFSFGDPQIPVYRVTVSAVASAIPATRAAGLDPMKTLRNQ